MKMMAIGLWRMIDETTDEGENTSLAPPELAPCETPEETLVEPFGTWQ